MGEDPGQHGGPGHPLTASGGRGQVPQVDQGWGPRRGREVRLRGSAQGGRPESQAEVRMSPRSRFIVYVIKSLYTL